MSAAAARGLDWDGYPNCRDLGGLETPYGPTRRGRVARGPRRELLTEAGWEAARAWRLRTVVDLRCPAEVGRRDADPGVSHAARVGVTVISAPTEDHDNAEFRRVCFPILDSPEYWTHNLRILPGMVRNALLTIAGATPGVLVHCSAGRDRTGMVCAILLANAGVPAELVADDYVASVRAMAGTATHAPSHDRQAKWSPAEVDAWVAHVRPLVVDFVRSIDVHLDVLGLRGPQGRAMRELLVGDRG